MLPDVVLDPGHGGSQQRGKSTPEGARLLDGRPERQLTYALAQRVSFHLGGARMTRAEQENPSLSERILVSRRYGARAFVSLHAGAPGAAGGVWVHARAGEPSVRLAEQLRDRLSPVLGGGLPLGRGELAVLSPDRHGPVAAAVLVELPVGAAVLGGRAQAASGLDPAAAAIARAIRAHLGRLHSYGRGVTAPAGRGLDTAELLPGGSPLERLRKLGDWIARQVTFIAGVADTTAFPNSAICRIETPEDGGWGTGFYVSPDRILTAGHVVEGMTRADVIPGKNGAGADPVHEPFGRFTVSGADIVMHPRYTRVGDFDLAVLKVSIPPPNGAYFEHLDPTPACVGPIAIVGYAKVGDPQQQHVDVDVVREVSGNLEKLGYNASTMGGSSGAPVFYTVEDASGVRDTGVVGVHIDQAAVTPGMDAYFNSCVRLTDDKLNWLWSL